MHACWLRIQDEAYGLFQELKRQAREAPRYEAQVQALSQAVVELEAQVHELQQENQVLAGLHPAFGATAAAGATGGGGIRYRATTLSTGVSTPDGGMYPCSPDRGGLGRLSEDTAAAAAGGGGGGGAAMTSNPLYADDAGLALSAMEQQLALAEQQRVEAVRSAETLERDNVRLRQDVERLETELSSLGSSTGYKVRHLTHHALFYTCTYTVCVPVLTTCTYHSAHHSALSCFVHAIFVGDALAWVFFSCRDFRYFSCLLVSACQRS